MDLTAQPDTDLSTQPDQNFNLYSNISTEKVYTIFWQNINSTTNELMEFEINLHIYIRVKEAMKEAVTQINLRLNNGWYNVIYKCQKLISFIIYSVNFKRIIYIKM